MKSESIKTALAPSLFVRSQISKRTTTVLLAIAAVILGVTSAMAWDGKVADWEKDILTSINGWPDWLEPFMWLVQQPGGILTPGVVAIALYWLTRRRDYFIAFFAVIPIKLVIEKGIIKNLVERDRPFQSIGPEIHVRGDAFEGLSFPSGHTTTAFAVFFLITAFVPKRWRFLPITWAAGVALARMYNGEHNLLDVVAGAALGTSFAIVLYYFVLNRCFNENKESKAVGTP